MSFSSSIAWIILTTSLSMKLTSREKAAAKNLVIFMGDEAKKMNIKEPSAEKPVLAILIEHLLGGNLPKPASSEAKQQPSTSNPNSDDLKNKFNKKERATELSNKQEQQSSQQPNKDQKRGMQAPKIEREGDLEQDLRSTPRNSLTPRRAERPLLCRLR